MSSCCHHHQWLAAPWVSQSLRELVSLYIPPFSVTFAGISCGYKLGAWCLRQSKSGRLESRFNFPPKTLRLRKRRGWYDWLSRCSQKQSPCTQDQARDMAKGWLVPSLLGSVYLLEDIRMLPGEAPPSHWRHRWKYKTGALFLSVINNWERRWQPERKPSLQLVLLEEDLCIHGAGGDAFGSLVWFDQLQLGVGQVFLGDLGLRGKNKQTAKRNSRWLQSVIRRVLIDQEYVFTVLIEWGGKCVGENK